MVSINFSLYCKLTRRLFKTGLVYWSTFIPRFVSTKISFVLGGIRFRFRLTDETLTHFLSFPSIQVNNCQKVSFCLFHCINRWLKNICEISLFLFLLLLQFKKKKRQDFLNWNKNKNLKKEFGISHLFFSHWLMQRNKHYFTIFSIKEFEQKLYILCCIICQVFW